jgi:hypothetical protein
MFVNSLASERLFCESSTQKVCKMAVKGPFLCESLGID